MSFAIMVLHSYQRYKLIAVDRNAKTMDRDGKEKKEKSQYNLTYATVVAEDKAGIGWN